jgi:2',3'-cyclic-nucleotide 2'-phosphodiesterase (5'-nucleotidase family)
VVAHSDRSLTSDRLVVRRQESELGNLFADAIRWQTGAEIAVVNGGSLRANLPKGNVTKGDCLAIFPFGNTIRMAEVQGKVIRQMMEHSVFSYPASFGGFLDFSGMTVDCDPTLPVGSRIKEIKVNGVLLDDERIYTLSTNDFLFAGGDNYEMLKGSKIVGESNTCEEVLSNYLNQVGIQDISTGRLTMEKVLDVPAEELDVPEAA